MNNIRRIFDADQINTTKITDRQHHRTGKCHFMQSRGLQTFQNPRSHLQIPGTRNVI
jgi:hypothetical protein